MTVHKAFVPCVHTHNMYACQTAFLASSSIQVMHGSKLILKRNICKTTHLFTANSSLNASGFPNLYSLVWFLTPHH